VPHLRRSFIAPKVGIRAKREPISLTHQKSTQPTKSKPDEPHLHAAD
jgi:hypothetical protein